MRAECLCRLGRSLALPRSTFEHRFIEARPTKPPRFPVGLTIPMDRSTHPTRIAELPRQEDRNAYVPEPIK